MTEQDWDSGFGRCVAVFLNGEGIAELDPRGERVTDDSFLLLLQRPPRGHRGHAARTRSTASAWAIVVDTATGEVIDAVRRHRAWWPAKPHVVAGGSVQHRSGAVGAGPAATTRATRRA